MKPVLEQNVTLFVPSDEAIEDFRYLAPCNFSGVLFGGALHEEMPRNTNVTRHILIRRDIETVTGTNEETRIRGEEGPTYNIDSGLTPKRRKRSSSELTVVEEPDLRQILKGHIVEGSLDTSQA